MPVARASSTIGSQGVPGELGANLRDLVGGEDLKLLLLDLGRLANHRHVAGEGAVLDGISQYAHQEAMGVADRARCQPCLEQSAVPLLHMLWPKLLKLQRTQVRDRSAARQARGTAPASSGLPSPRRRKTPEGIRRASFGWDQHGCRRRRHRAAASAHAARLCRCRSPSRNADDGCRDRGAGRI